jgi:hypothetical protein
VKNHVQTGNLILAEIVHSHVSVCKTIPNTVMEMLIDVIVKLDGLANAVTTIV